MVEGDPTSADPRTSAANFAQGALSEPEDPMSEAEAGAEGLPDRCPHFNKLKALVARILGR